MEHNKNGRTEVTIARKFALQTKTGSSTLSSCERHLPSVSCYQLPGAAYTPRTRKKNWSIGFSSLTWRCRMMLKTRNLAETVQYPSTNAQTSERFSFTGNRARKIMAGPETSRPRNFILRPTVADAPRTKSRHSKPLQIPKLPMAVKPPAVFVTHLSPGRKSLPVRMQVIGPF
jgi:hypothetical protein